MNIDPNSLELESGGVDMPDAYQSLPVLPERVAHNVIEVPSADGGI